MKLFERVSFRVLVSAVFAILVLFAWLLSGFFLTDGGAVSERDSPSLSENQKLKGQSRTVVEIGGGIVSSAPSASPAEHSVQRATPAAESYSALSLDPRPASRYKAYHMLRKCNDIVNSLEFAAHLPRDGEGAKTYDEVQRGRVILSSDACKDLPYRNGTIRSEHARIAAEHGIPGASADYYFEGPNGNINDLLLRPTDQMMQDWFRHSTGFLVRDAEVGQAEAAYLLAQIYSMGPSGFRDKYLAAKYESLGLALLERTGSLTESQKAARRSAAQSAKSDLSAEQVSAIESYVNRNLR